MSLVGRLAEFFLFSLALGVGSFSFLADTRQTGVGFIKLISTICALSLFLATLFYLTHGHWSDGQGFCYGVGLLAYGAIFFFHGEHRTPVMWAFFGVHTVILALALIFSPHFVQGPMDILFALSSIFFMGVISYAMLMGHWYLVTPKLSELPLKKCHFFLWGILALKISLIFMNYEKLWFFLKEGASQDLALGLLFYKILFLMRLTWGYGAIGMMSFFSYRLVALRSLQSATGFFYVMTFLVFGGELISLYFFFRYGIYL